MLMVLSLMLLLFPASVDVGVNSANIDAVVVGFLVSASVIVAVAIVSP